MNFWVLEKGEVSKPEYAFIDEENFCNWTEDIHKAVKFADRDSAEQLAVIMDDATRVLEHVYDDGMACGEKY